MPQEFRRIVGQRLRAARIVARLKQEDVARDFLRSRQAVSAWETGKSFPDLFEFRELLLLYGVSADRILFDMEDAESAGQKAVSDILSRSKLVCRDFEPSRSADDE